MAPAALHRPARRFALGQLQHFLGLAPGRRRLVLHRAGDFAAGRLSRLLWRGAAAAGSGRQAFAIGVEVGNLRAHFLARFLAESALSLATDPESQDLAGLQPVHVLPTKASLLLRKSSDQHLLQRDVVGLVFLGDLGQRVAALDRAVAILLGRRPVPWPAACRLPPAAQAAWLGRGRRCRLRAAPVQPRRLGRCRSGCYGGASGGLLAAFRCPAGSRPAAPAAARRLPASGWGAAAAAGAAGWRCARSGGSSSAV